MTRNTQARLPHKNQTKHARVHVRPEQKSDQTTPQKAVHVCIAIANYRTRVAIGPIVSSQLGFGSHIRSDCHRVACAVHPCLGQRT